MNNYIKGPLNYTGGKYGLLKYILPNFPVKIDKFIDLFAGGLNVGINVKAKTIFVNDHNSYVIEMYEMFKNTSINELLLHIEDTIVRYGLSQKNDEGYNKLRQDYNRNQNPLFLFVLICYAFNHQIRFNNSMQFNTPFGKERSSFNDTIKMNLINFCNKLKSDNYIFSCTDFRKFQYELLTKNDVVYCDPPYLITTGSYNDGNRGFSDWKAEEDKALLKILDELNDRGIPFFLSNVFKHKGMTNDYLIEWSKKYRVIYIDKKYSNCSYHFKDRTTETVEVLITNYEVPQYE